jgi:uncharacterized protein
MTIDQRPRTPLQEAIAWRDPQRVQAALVPDVDLEERGRLGRTALHQAAATGVPEYVRLLLDRGAQIDPRDDAGNTPLMCAVLLAEPGDRAAAEIVGLLLTHGADPAAANQAGATPQSFARAEGSDPAIAEQFAPWTGPALPRVEIADSTPNQAVLAVDGRKLTLHGERIVLDHGGTDRVLDPQYLGGWDDGEPTDPHTRELLRCYLVGTGSLFF